MANMAEIPSNNFEIMVDDVSTFQYRISFKLLRYGIFLSKSRYTEPKIPDTEHP